MHQGDVIALFGGLAAGKTTLTKGLALSLGIEEPITSPTYTIISEYRGKLPLYHMDCYRIEGASEALAIGIDELLYGEGVCVIEWSERIQELLPDTTIKIEISLQDSGNRRIRIDNAALEAQL